MVLDPKSKKRNPEKQVQLVTYDGSAPSIRPGPLCVSTGNEVKCKFVRTHFVICTKSNRISLASRFRAPVIVVMMVARQFLVSVFTHVTSTTNITTVTVTTAILSARAFVVMYICIEQE